MVEATDKVSSGFTEADVARMEANPSGRAQAMALLIRNGVIDKLKEAEKQAKQDGLETTAFCDAVIGLLCATCFSFTKKDPIERMLGTAAMVDFIRQGVMRAAELNIKMALEKHGEPPRG
jgi:hypothetical protein